VVVTVMTNLAFHQAMDAAGIRVVTTAVGDRFVLEAMEGGGFVLGGEQSGHIIDTSVAPTGDGLASALGVLGALGGRTLRDAAAVVQPLPQTLVNVRLDAPAAEVLTLIGGDIADAEQRLGHAGRILVRPSGTEPLLRVMVEAPTREQAETVASQLAQAARNAAHNPR
jgi:phosphoglucosamine mutase